MNVSFFPHSLGDWALIAVMVVLGPLAIGVVRSSMTGSDQKERWQRERGGV